MGTMFGDTCEMCGETIPYAKSGMFTMPHVCPERTCEMCGETIPYAKSGMFTMRHVCRSARW